MFITGVTVTGDVTNPPDPVYSSAFGTEFRVRQFAFFSALRLGHGNVGLQGGSRQLTTSYARHYAGQKVFLTGGLGFLGSNLALRLLELGAKVTIADSAVESCGANLANLAPHTAACRIRLQDIGDAQDLRDSIAESAVVFDLAGDISHGHSMQWPERDLWRNTSAHLRLLQECALTRPGIRYVFASTRQVYGQPRTLPVDEGHPIHPSDFNGVHKHATEQYCQLLTAQGQVDAVILRLTNIY